MPTPDEVRAVVDAYVDRTNAGDKDAVVALFRPDAVWHDPVGEPPHEGHEGIAAFWDQVHALAERIELKPHDVIVSGPEAALVFEIHTVVGETLMELDAVEIFEVGDDRRIVTLRAYWDMTRASARALR